MNKNIVLAAAMAIALGSAVSSEANAEDLAHFKVENPPSVMVLSEASAETAWTLLSAGATEVSAKRPALDTRTIVYVDVNSIDVGPEDLKILGDARRGGNTIIFESATWSVTDLHAFVESVFPDIQLSGLNNVALAIVSEKGGARAVDLTPSQAAMMIGVPFFETEEGRSQSAGRSKSTPIHYLAPFASSAYQASPQHSGFVRLVNQDVLKIWRKPGNPPPYGDPSVCVVAFKGTISVGDWLRNAESQFGSLVVPYTGYSGTARIGHGYKSRLDNLWNAIAANTTDCALLHVTGHSLGGAMAEVGAFRLRAQLGRRIGVMASFNPARVGNAAFRTAFQSNVPVRKVYCRHGDPVWYVPLTLQHVASNDHGCTDWGNRASWWNGVANHAMALWL